MADDLMKDNGESKHLTVTFTSADGKRGDLKLSGNLEDRKAVLVLAEALKLIAGGIRNQTEGSVTSKTMDVPYRPGKVA